LKIFKEQDSLEDTGADGRADIKMDLLYAGRLWSALI
jgi:hypothetical protein